MRNFILLLMICSGFRTAHAQPGVRYDPSVQQTKNMQYFRPSGNLFVGDCMPFFKDGTFYLYWLVDSAHHAALNGLGGHQWVLSTTKDLKNWVQHPVVLGTDEEWEKSICTGSIVFYKNQFYAFYATRLLENGKVNEQLSYAISDDGINFKKQKPNPFFTSAPGYSKRNFRDPKVVVDSSGTFHLFVSTQQDSVLLKGLDGCLAHMISSDLKHWTFVDPLITGQASVPECPDYFFWNGWYYLIYSDNSNTFYMKSRFKYGPWQEPAYQVLDEAFSNVVKCADFNNGRKIAASWIPNRLDNKDNSHEIFGGNLLLREVRQLSNGDLSTSFPLELMPPSGKPLTFKMEGVESKSDESDKTGFTIENADGVGSSHIGNIPGDVRITMEITPQGPNAEFGVFLRSSTAGTDGYKLAFQYENKIVSLGNTQITAVENLDKKIQLEIIMKNSIIDVSINKTRCIINRLPEKKGDQLWFFVKHGKVNYSSIQVMPLENR